MDAGEQTVPGNVVTVRYDILGRWTRNLLSGTTVQLPSVKLEPPSVSWTIAIMKSGNACKALLQSVEGSDAESVIFKGEVSPEQADDLSPTSNIDPSGGVIGQFVSGVDAFVYLSLSFLGGQVMATLGTDLKRLLDSGEGSDVVLRTTGVNEEQVEIKAHKAILSARSPVFLRIFSTNMAEARGGQVAVKFPAKAVRVMLNYIYSNQADDLEECCFDVLAAADYYDIERLKTLCESWFMDHIELGSVLNVLAWSERYRALRLKMACLQFALDRIRDVMASAEWNEFCNSNPRLLNTLLGMMNANAPQDSEDESDEDASAKVSDGDEEDEYNHFTNECFLRFRIALPDDWITLVQQTEGNPVPRVLLPVFRLQNPPVSFQARIFFDGRAHIEGRRLDHGLNHLRCYYSGDREFLKDVTVYGKMAGRCEDDGRREHERDQEHQIYTYGRIAGQTHHAYIKIHYVREDGVSSLGADCLKLLQSEKLCDAVLLVRAPGEEQGPETRIKVHKCILAARSPVFRRIFAVPSENEVDEVQVPFSEPVVRRLLGFLYSEHLLDEDGLREDLFDAAVRYELHHLKWLCAERFICDQLNVANALRLLLCAEKHGLDFLWSRVLALISRNLQRVMALPEWLEFSENHVALVKTILETAAKKGRSLPRDSVVLGRFNYRFSCCAEEH